MNLVRVAAPLLLLADVAALLAVGTIVRRRTRNLRRGMVPGPERAGAWRTSRTTHLAWLGGSAAGLWAISLGGPAAVALGPAAAFVSVTGVLFRVTGLEVDGEALIVRYAVRRPRRLRWRGCRSLRPPHGPLGAWRIDGGEVAASLMPSDVLGNEGVLAEVARRADLAFDRGGWGRPARPGLSPRR